MAKDSWLDLDSVGGAVHALVMLTFAQIAVGVSDPDRASEFWKAALGYVRKEEPGHDEEWMVLVPAEGVAGPAIALDRSESPTPDRPRVHLDLQTASADDLRHEVDRLVGLGAHRVDWDLYPSDEPGYVVLADTEGNRFCVGYPQH